MEHYKIDELELKNDSEEEQSRTRNIFEDLKNRIDNGIYLLEREKTFFCTCLKLSSYESDGKLTDYKICNDFIFRELYLTYFHNNLSGPFHKAVKGRLVQVSFTEQANDFKKLIQISNEWEKIITLTNHKDQILKEISVETIRDLKSLKKKYSGLNKIFKKQKDDYSLKKDKLILQSKFIFMLILEVIQNNPPENFEIPFCDEIIEFNLFSLVHIINRHYAEPIKDNSQKTYHYDNFYPSELHIDLKNILTEIDTLKVIDIKNTDNIIFVYNNVVYQLYIQKRFKQVKGIGNVEILRVQTFYPIYETDKTQQINDEFTLTKINDVLQVYHK